MKTCLVSYDDIISIENLLEAWREFRRGKKQKKDAQEFEQHLMTHVLNLHQDLQEKTYVHSAYHAFNIADPKPRDIHKASVRDRLLHHAIYRVLYPYFDARFIHDSYSCRNNKGTHRALLRFKAFGYKVSKNNTKTCFVLKCDIRKFFASIDQEILLCVLGKKIEDRDIVWLLRRVIQSFNSGKPDIGLPLGNLTSQLLVNIYMNEFDQYVKHILRVKYYIRYADDFVIFSQDKKYLETVLEQMKEFLETKLHLCTHPDKVFIKTTASGVDFLGWTHFPYHRVLRTVTKRKMLRKVSEKNIESYRGMLRWGNGWKVLKKVEKRVFYD
jgi:RNA-directed DNA polymerase